MSISEQSVRNIGKSRKSGNSVLPFSRLFLFIGLFYSDRLEYYEWFYILLFDIIRCPYIAITIKQTSGRIKDTLTAGIPRITLQSMIAA